MSVFGWGYFIKVIKSSDLGCTFRIYFLIVCFYLIVLLYGITYLFFFLGLFVLLNHLMLMYIFNAGFKSQQEMRRRQVEALESDRRRVSVNHCAILLFFMYVVLFVTCLKYTISKIIHERRQLADTMTEPQDGIVIQVKYPHGTLKRRKFLITQPFQVIYEFLFSFFVFVARL